MAKINVACFFLGHGVNAYSIIIIIIIIINLCLRILYCLYLLQIYVRIVIIIFKCWGRL